jgi:hypothetical protein
VASLLGVAIRVARRELDLAFEDENVGRYSVDARSTWEGFGKTWKGEKINEA